MITRSTISNFKRLETATLELGNAVVLVGPNNSGKTSALQAMTLWEVGWRRWTFPSARPSATGPTPAPGSTARSPAAGTIPIQEAQIKPEFRSANGE